MNLQQKYYQEIKNQLQKDLGIKNIMAVPKLIKIVINVGLGEALSDHKVIDKVIEQIAVISGQKPAVTRASMSISTFKLRAGDKIGVKVTLRSKKMYAFFEKLTGVVLPKLRDFRGMSRNSFDGSGNYSLGLGEQTLFPEIEYGKIDKVRGMEITIVTSAKNDEFGLKLLEKLGMPFEKIKN